MKALLPALLLAAACGSSHKYVQYVRVVEPSGRAYYAETSYALYSEAGGFVTFRDLVTSDTVKLTNGRYSATPCSEEEVADAQERWLQDPKKPLQSEYDPEKGMDPGVWR